MNQQSSPFSDFDESEDLPDLSALLDLSDIEDDTPGMEPVFSVMRDERDGRLVVEIDGVHHRTLVGQKEVRQHFLEIIKELSQAINSPDPLAEESITAAPITPSVQATPPPQPEPAHVSPPPIQPTAPPTTASPSKPVSQFEDGVPGALPNYNLEDASTVSKGRFGQIKVEAKPIPELNIAAAIEAFLQHKLSQTPEYARRQIHVHNAPGGFLRIQVDDKYYEAVGDVEDKEVREFLSATIQEWQSRQGR